MTIVTDTLTLPRGRALKRIHVVGQQIQRNKRDGTNLPCFTVKFRGETYWCHGFRVHGQTQAKQDFTNRLSSGAVCWLETYDAVTLLPEPA